MAKLNLTPKAPTSATIFGTSHQGQASESYEKAAGYINLSVPMEDGDFAPLTRRGVALLLSEALPADLVAHLDSMTQEEANNWVNENIRLTYWSKARDAKPVRKIKFG